MSNPDKYESIVAYSDKKKIIETFGSLVANPRSMDQEAMIRTIKTQLYNKYGAASVPMRKDRWFFYQDDVKPLWKKTTKRERRDVGISIQIECEENARNLDILEGQKYSQTTTSLSRSAKLVKQTKG